MEVTATTSIKEFEAFFSFLLKSLGIFTDSSFGTSESMTFNDLQTPDDFWNVS